MKFNYTLLKAFLQRKLEKDNITLKEILKPLKISEKRFNKILNNEGYFKVNEMLLLLDKLDIPANMIELVFYDKEED